MIGSRTAWKAICMVPGVFSAVANVILHDPKITPHLGPVIREVGHCVGRCSRPQMEQCLGRALCQHQGHPATARQRRLLFGVALPLRRALRDS
jgi:hypothetical protein